MPRNVKLLSASHSRKATASAISAAGNGGGAVLSSAITSATRAVIARQSRTQRRTSASTCSIRSEEHTSELQSRENLVCRLLLEKKKKNRYCLAVVQKKEKMNEH